jgi:hypothetical protein
MLAQTMVSCFRCRKGGTFIRTRSVSGLYGNLLKTVISF